MKKLLITSALVAGFASSAFAHAGPTVTLGGSLDTQLGVRSQKSGYDTDAANPVAGSTTQNKVHKYAIVNDTRIHVKADGKAGNGLKYGGKVVLKGDTSQDKFNHASSGFNEQFETSSYVESMFGHLSAGSMTGVVDSMSVSGASVARATGGIDGDWKYWVNPNIHDDTPTATTPVANNPERTVAANFINRPTLPSNYDAGGEASAAKVSYMTPTYAGFKAGLSYIPDIEQHGSTNLSHIVLKNANTNATDPTLGFKNIWSGGLHYAGKMSNVGLKASLLGETGDAKNATLAGTNPVRNRHDLRAWTIGGSMNMSGFTLAASYGDWGKSGVHKALAGGKKRSTYWTLGGSYEYGAMGASVTYMESKRAGIDSTLTAASTNVALAKAKQHRNVSLGLDYKMAPGFMPYAEVSFFKLDEKNSGTAANAHNKKNDGSVFLAGTKLSF